MMTMSKMEGGGGGVISTVFVSVAVGNVLIVEFDFYV